MRFIQLTKKCLKFHRRSEEEKETFSSWWRAIQTWTLSMDCQKAKAANVIPKYVNTFTIFILSACLLLFRRKLLPPCAVFLFFLSFSAASFEKEICRSAQGCCCWMDGVYGVRIQCRKIHLNYCVTTVDCIVLHEMLRVIMLNHV